MFRQSNVTAERLLPPVHRKRKRKKRKISRSRCRSPATFSLSSHFAAPISRAVIFSSPRLKKRKEKKRKKGKKKRWREDLILYFRSLLLSFLFFSKNR
ncbi:hypothetical protein CEXT_77351 [Caerostris extrusa]|uniref:Uncharacterized protein n=1 Tax=Caerostris extrusa TaxID=172846 RepID=A0AAV4UAN1_CAEEX|nr:hypothetical protein CEXT_77351 [Caerostris extrusa]